MIDFIKIFFFNGKGINLTALTFYSMVDTRSGEVKGNWIFGEYKGLKLKYHSTKKHLEISGSIHKAFYHGSNYQDFSFFNLLDALDDLCRELGLNPKYGIIQGLEFGLNINPGFPTYHLLQGIVSLNTVPFSSQKNGRFKEAELSEYIIKIYDKGNHYQVNEEIMRLELKTLKGRVHQKFGIKTLEDLKRNHWQMNALNFLIQKWEEVFFIDPTLSLPEGMQEQIFKWQNAGYWKSLSRMQRMREKAKLRQLTANHSKDLQSQITYLMESKFEKLFPEMLRFHPLSIV
jgi:hypothetical protein